MQKVETWEIEMPEDPQDFTSKTFYQWKAAVLKTTDMAEYRLRKLYKLGYTPEEIAADKHHEVFPPATPRPKRPVRGTTATRGGTLGAKRKAWLYARALRDTASTIIQFYRLDPDMLQATRQDLEFFRKAMIRYGHKKPKEPIEGGIMPGAEN